MEIETIEIDYGDVLICDPCYIKFAGDECNGKSFPRFDLLRCEKVLHNGDDGEFPVYYKGESKCLGVDSGRIWQMVAEFDGIVKIDAGISDYWLIKGGKFANA